jgi:hexosaminidase
MKDGKKLFYICILNLIKPVMNRIFLFVMMCAIVTCIAAQTNTYHIVPKPAKLKPQQGQFVFDADTRIIVPTDDIDMHHAAFALLERLLLSTGFNNTITVNTNGHIKPGKNMVYCKLNTSISNKEAYKMTIEKDRIEIEASAPAGFFYAMQTIRQLLPPEIERSVLAKDVTWAVPCATIEDEPRYPYRGLMLDVCRHFSDAASVKRYIDKLAFHKINRFHWHLTDDQGWRIEIKKYPKLAEVSAWRDRTLIGPYVTTGRKYKQERYGGFYTQEQVKEIVAYAKKKFVTVIPEIEMPGHAVAALAAYPELSCTGGPFEVEGLWGIFNDVYCPRDNTFEFLENVIAEVAELFPSEYIHIGGDECPKLRWQNCHHCQTMIKELGLKDEHELQSYFVARMEKFINSKGKRIIGWDEILEGGLAPNATVMSWRGQEGGIAAAKQGHDVIMTPTSFCYLDYYQSEDRDREPLSIGGYVPMEKVYSFDPTPETLTDKEARHILGGQCNLWREYIATETHVEYMLFPRLAALSEAVWTPRNEKNYDHYMIRLTGILKHYDAMNINYSRSNLK